MQISHCLLDLVLLLLLFPLLISEVALAKKKSGNNWNEKHICQQMNGENDGEVGIRAKFGRHTNEMIKEYFEYSLG